HDRFLNVIVAALENEAHINRIAVANRNGRLQKLEQHVPHSSERVGAGLEVAEIFHSPNFSSRMPRWRTAGKRRPKKSRWVVLKEDGWLIKTKSPLDLRSRANRATLH